MRILPPDFARLFPRLVRHPAFPASPDAARPPPDSRAALSVCLHGLLERGGLQAVTWPSPASVLASCPQLFLKEHLHQLLEGMREHVLNLAALTLQRCLRGFFIQRRFRSLRHKIILLQSRARGYLARCGPERAGLPGVQRLGSGKAEPELG